MLQGIFDRHKTYPKAVQRLAYVLKWLLIFYFAIQCFLGSTPAHTVRAGIENRAFIAKLSEWRNYLEQAQTKEGLSYDYNGLGTDMLDSYPSMPKVLTPGRSPDDIYQTLHAISPKCFSLKTPIEKKGG